MDRATRNRLGRDPLRAIRPFAWALVLALLVIRPVAAQQGEDVPGVSYWRAVEAIYAGEYRDAERALRRETNRGIQTTQPRWIDSICYRAMLGEVLYQQGRNPEALAEFDNEEEAQEHVRALYASEADKDKKAGRVFSKQNADLIKSAVDNLLQALKNAGVMEGEQEEIEDETEAIAEDDPEMITKHKAGPVEPPTNELLRQIDLELFELEVQS